MAQTRIRIEQQLQKSVTPSSILYTNASNNPAYFAPSTGADRILFYDDSATSLAWLNIGAGLSLAGTTLSVSGGSSGYSVIQEEGSTVGPGNTIINFVGAGLLAADAGSGITSVTVDPTLNALAAYNTNGILTQTAPDTFTGRTLTAPAAGFTITDPAGVAGNPTFVLANDLAALEALSGTGFATRTGSDTWAQRSFQGTTDRITVTNDNGVGGNPTFDIASTYVGQATITTLGTITSGTWNANPITAVYGGTGQTSVAVGDILYGSGVNVWSRRAIGGTGAFLRVSSGLPVWATAASTDLSDTAGIAYLANTQTFTGTNTFNNNIVIPTTPTLGTHAASKDYVDSIVANQRTKQVRVATTANITLSGEQTIDGITTSGSRVLVKNQTVQAENGIYVSAAGAWTRATDMDAASEVDATFLVVEDGTVGAGTIWVTASEVTTLGTDAIVFTQINSATDIVAGAGLTKTGLTLDIGTASVSRIVVNTDNIDLATTAVAAGSYGGVSQVATFTVDAYGRLTSAGQVTIEASNFIEIANSDAGYTWTENNGSVDTGPYFRIVAPTGGGVRLSVDDTNDSIRIRHEDTSSILNVDTVGAEVVDTITFDTFGHVTGLTLRTLTLADLGGAGDTTIAYLEGATGVTVALNSGTAVKDRDGANIAFTLPTNIDNFEVYRNGILQSRSGTITTRDYQVNTGTNEITFVVSLATDEIVIFKKR